MVLVHTPSRRRAHHYLHNYLKKPPPSLSTQRPQTPFEGEDAVHISSAGGQDGRQGVAAAAAGPASACSEWAGREPGHDINCNMAEHAGRQGCSSGPCT